MIIIIVLYCICFYQILTTAKIVREMLHISNVLRAFPLQYLVLYYNDVLCK